MLRAGVERAAPATVEEGRTWTYTWSASLTCG